MSVTFALELTEAVRATAEEAGLPLSDWLAQAAEAKIRADGQARILEEAEHQRRLEDVGKYLDEREAEHGPSPRRKWPAHGAGALIAIDRDDREVHSQLRDAKRNGDPVRTNAMALAQVWRDGKGRQARLARILRDITVEPITREDGLRAGELLGATRMTDAIDASVALLAAPGDRVLTSDAQDLRALCGAAGVGLLA